MVAAALDGLAEVDRVCALGVVGPAGEGVALAGRGQGLAGDAVAVGNALERLVAVEERAAVGCVEDVDGVGLDVHVPLGVERHVVAAALDGLAEVDRVCALGVVGPAGEGVALAGRGQGLAGDAVAVGHALEGVTAVEERAAVGDVEDVDGVILLNGIPLSIKGSVLATADERVIKVDRIGTLAVVGPAGEGVALAGRGQGLAGDAVAVGHALEGVTAVEERAAVGDVEDVDGVILLNGIPLSIKGSVLATADERVIKVDRIGTLAVVGPAGEGVALAGRGQGLAGDAVAVGHALQDFVAISENTAVGDIENVLLVVSKLCPLSEERSMLTATLDGLGEVDRLGAGSIVGPASKGIALAGRGQGLAGNAVAVGNTLHGLIAIGENATIGNIENRLLVVLLPLGINSRVAAARNDGLREVDGVISVAIVRPTKEVIALAGRLKRQTCNTVGIGYTLHSYVAIGERAAIGNVEDFDSLVLLHRRPSGEKGHRVAATDDRLVEVNLVGSVAVIIPTGKHIAVARRSKRLTSNAIAVSLTQHDVVAVGKLTAIGRVGHIEHIRGSLSPLGEQNNKIVSVAQKRLRKIYGMRASVVIIPAAKHIAIAHGRLRHRAYALIVSLNAHNDASVRESAAAIFRYRRYEQDIKTLRAPAA